MKIDHPQLVNGFSISNLGDIQHLLQDAYGMKHYKTTIDKSLLTIGAPLAIVAALTIVKHC